MVGARACQGRGTGLIRKLALSKRARMARWLWIMAAAMLPLAGCATHPAPKSASAAVALDDADRLVVKTSEILPLPDAAAENVAAGSEETAGSADDGAVDDYRLGAGDVIDFRSFDDPTLSQQGIVVRYDGRISLPQIPDVAVAGKTRDEVNADLAKAYSGIFKNPQVSVTVRDSASKLYYVMGEVNRPSSYPYRRPITVLEAVNDAGGLRISTRGGDSFVGAQGQLTKALIIRHKGDQREVMDFDLRGLAKSGPHAADTPVLPGDVVYVPEGVNLVYLIGEVRRSDVFQLTEGMTLLQLLTQAGGPNFPTARIKHVVLIRPIDPERTDVQRVDVRQILHGGKDMPLKPGDIVYVPRKRAVRLQEIVTRLTGTVSPILSLYNQAYDTYYVRDRYERLFSGSGTTNATLTTLENLRSFGSLLGTLSTLPTTP